MIRITDRSASTNPSSRKASCARPVPAGRTSTSSRPRCSCASTCGSSPSLPNDVAVRLMRLAGRRMTKDGVLVLIAQNHRTQERNRAEAQERLVALIREAAVKPMPRRATKPTKASKQKRLEGKKRRASDQGTSGRASRRSNSGGSSAAALAGAALLRGRFDVHANQAAHARPPAFRNHWSTASPPARWSSARRAWSRNWSRTRSTPAPRGSRSRPTAAGAG